MKSEQPREFVIPAMDYTAIQVDDDGDLTISQTAPNCEEVTITVPRPFVSHFIAVLTAVTAPKDRAEPVAGVDRHA